MVLFVTQSFALLQGIPLLASPASRYFGALFCQALWIPSRLQGTATNRPLASASPAAWAKAVRLKIRATTLAFFSAERRSQARVDEAWPFAPPAGLFTSRPPAAPSDSPDPPDPPGCGRWFSTHQHRQQRWAFVAIDAACGCVSRTLAPVGAGRPRRCAWQRNFRGRVSLGQDVSMFQHR